MTTSTPRRITVTVFGNEVDESDATALRLLPYLKIRFPNIEFSPQDPTESIDPPGDPWIILDTAIGIDEVTLIDSLDDLEYVKGSSVHDFDVYMELRLSAKLHRLPRLQIILVPAHQPVEDVVSKVESILEDAAGARSAGPAQSHR